MVVSMYKLIQDNITYITLGVTAVLLIALVLIIILYVKHSKLRKKYNAFMTGEQAINLEQTILTRFKEIEKLKEASTLNISDIAKIKEQLEAVYQKIGVVKYDAFKEMGGKLSFVLVLLDNKNSGILLNSVHSSREGCYTYLKEIIRGESFIELSADEKEALRQAMNSNSYME